MKYLIDNINNQEYVGTPEEIAELLSLRDNRDKQTETRPEPTIWDDEDITPMTSTITESEELRKKLANDPAWNPYGGVVPPKDVDGSGTLSPAVSADDNTGVQLV